MDTEIGDCFVGSHPEHPTMIGWQCRRPYCPERDGWWTKTNPDETLLSKPGHPVPVRALAKMQAESHAGWHTIIDERGVADSPASDEDPDGTVVHEWHTMGPFPRAYQQFRKTFPDGTVQWWEREGQLEPWRVMAVPPESEPVPYTLRDRETRA